VGIESIYRMVDMLSDNWDYNRNSLEFEFLYFVRNDSGGHLCNGTNIYSEKGSDEKIY